MNRYLRYWLMLLCLIVGVLLLVWATNQAKACDTPTHTDSISWRAGYEMGKRACDKVSTNTNKCQQIITTDSVEVCDTFLHRYYVPMVDTAPSYWLPLRWKPDSGSRCDTMIKCHMVAVKPQVAGAAEMPNTFDTGNWVYRGSFAFGDTIPIFYDTLITVRLTEDEYKIFRQLITLDQYQLDVIMQLVADYEHTVDTITHTLYHLKSSPGASDQ